MPAKRLNPAMAASSTAAHPPRRRSSALLSSNTNGSERWVSAASFPPVATVVPLPVKKSGLKSLTYSSGDANAPHVGTKVLAATAKAAPARSRAAASVPANHTASPPAAPELVPSRSPAIAPMVQRAPTLSNRSAASIAHAARRPRCSSSTPSVTAPPATVDAAGVSPAVANGSSKTGLFTASTAPPSLPTAKHASHYAYIGTNFDAAPPTSTSSCTENPQANWSVPASGPRRLSSASSNATKVMTSASGAAATPSAPVPEASASHAGPRDAPAPRQRANESTASTSKPNGQLTRAAAPSTDSAAAPGASSCLVAQASLKPSVSSSATGKKVIRRAVTGTDTSGLLSTTTTSRRPSLSGTATADNTTVPKRASSVLLPQPQSSGGAVPTLDAEGAPSTTLNTARTTAPTAFNTPTNAGSTVSGRTTARLSRGPVVLEEWARSIIKPGDEKLLYWTRVAGATSCGFTRTSSGIGMNSTAASAARQASTLRSLTNDTQLRRAQKTVLRQRHTETSTPSWRSTKAASVGAGSVASVASGGSDSRFGSTVKRSGVSLLRRQQEGKDRQRSLTATMATPTGGNRGSVGDGRVSNTSAAVGSASPTPSRISEASTNTTMRGNGRLSGSGARPLLEQLPGGAFVQAEVIGQRRSPSLKLFAKPSPRMISAPNPRGNTGAPGLKTTFGVNDGPYYVGNEELTKLTWVREEMLRALMQSAAPLAMSAATKENSAAVAVASMPNPKDGGNANILESSSSSLLTMHFDPVVSGTARASPTSLSVGKRPRQRVYSVDLRGGASNDDPAPPMQPPAAGVAQPRGRLVSSGTTPVLASSIRQKPGNSVSLACPAPTSTPTGVGTTLVPTSARPTLDSSAVVAGEPPPPLRQRGERQPRRPAVLVALSSLQSPGTVAERVRLEFVRQEQKQSTAVPTGKKKAPVPSSVVTAIQRPTAISINAATRLLLLDPLFPLISEENYQRLVLQNDEYTARKALLAHIAATPGAATAVSHPYGSPSPVPPLDVGKKPRKSEAEAPRAARALETDLAEADEPAPVLPLTVAVLAPTQVVAIETGAAAAPLSPSVSPPNAAIIGSTPPRRPSLQHGGPALYATFSPPRVTSPPNASNLTSPIAGSAAGFGGTTSPAHDSRLLVNAVMPTEKPGSIKLLAAGSAWYAVTRVSESTPSSTIQSSLHAGLLATACGGGAARGTSNSPTRPRSTSPMASCSSLRSVTRRGSLLQGLQQHLPHQATRTVASNHSDSISDEDSTASDEAVDLAEAELRKTLPHWGPFRTSHTAASSASDILWQKRATNPGTSPGSTTASTTTPTAARKTKSAHEETVPVASLTDSTPSLLSMALTLSPAMAKELQAYVHEFLKRYRGADSVTAEEMGPIPKTPLALQRAIRHSLRLSTESSASGVGDEEAVELEDALDDGSYHSQNVQYILGLMGSLLQGETSFCEDDDARTASGAHLRTAAAERHRKEQVTSAELIAAVMGRPLSSTVEDTTEGAALNYTRNDTSRSAAARPLLKLHDPELRAVELLFVNGAP
ncbi:hypothetical protein LPMP_340610 [Leishmania panamensis]|uniref:Uncharacterized protein n=1 Tax=Leishmania panamensis TaxID=5679 RepID=A0A088RZZ8_LEIPA|nr:hypothetical protein LPMP_340610 [Leishmania panamensis]AIO01688.1 hypothetical protein LPMP_340610 [Leishmania panamensis]